MPQYRDYVRTARFPAILGFPLPPGVWRFRSGYGDRFHPIDKAWKLHDGVDLVAVAGVPVLAAADGVVVGRHTHHRAGNYLSVRHTTNTGIPMFTEYLHLLTFLVTVGDRVRQGQTIGLVGSTGASTGPHLHFRVKYGGRTLNPEAMLGLVPGGRSLPPAPPAADGGLAVALLLAAGAAGAVFLARRGGR